MEWNVFSVAIAVGWILSQCSAQDFSCTVSRRPDGVTYMISDESRPKDYDASNCTFIWINNTDYTVATEKEKIPVVTKTSVNELKTSRCMENMVCKQHCQSKEGVWKDFKAICTTSCAENSSSHGDEPDLNPGFNNRHLIGIVAGFIILVAGVGLILYIFRKKIPRCRCGNYHFVRAQNAAEEPPV